MPGSYLELQARADSAFDPAGPGLLGVILFEADGIAPPSSATDWRGDYGNLSLVWYKLSVTAIQL